jgi:hypothetical protein
MKNIHLIPTDKPSRLIFNSFHKSFCYQKEIDSMYINDGKVSGADFWGLEKAFNNGFKPQNIYITSDEEIKEGDWFFNGENVLQASRITDIIIDTEGQWSEIKTSKKIILTTDQDLIANNVQTINDTFLEWFVKNSNCEFVKTDKVDTFKKTNEVYVDEITRGNYYEIIKQYKIIEEPKCFDCKGVIKDGICFCNREEPKQECLHQESRFRDYYKDGCYKCWECGKIVVEEPKQEKLTYTEAVKKEERRYSEEDLREAFRQGQDNMDYSDTYGWDSKLTEQEWFEQFKKK